MTQTPPPTDRLREPIDPLALARTILLQEATNQPSGYWRSVRVDNLDALCRALLAQADRAERLEHALRLARPHLEFDCIDDEDQKVLEAARDTVDAALADAEGGT